MAIFIITSTNDSTTDTGIGNEIGTSGDYSGTLREALNFANQNAAANPTTSTTIDVGSGVSGTINLAGNLPLVATSVQFNGGGLTLNGGGHYRGFLVTGVASTSDGVPPAITVGISNLAIQNVTAQGGAGADGGGGGLGAGGAVFVGENANVTLTNVDVSGANAQGGAGAAKTAFDTGGGGGLVGGGGLPTGSNGFGGGGGGLLFGGGGASGANGDSGGGGGGGITGGGASGTENTQNQQGLGGNGGAGLGSLGGGGGGGSFGGGTAGTRGGTGANPGTAYTGGAGGFGGGGGGGTAQGGVGGFGGGGGGSNGAPAAGGFGGGGGGGNEISNNGGGAGGFGGGGGANFNPNYSGGSGGVGAGSASRNGTGGGGLSAGGAVFVTGSRTVGGTTVPGGTLNVVGGSFSGDSVTASTGANAGAAVGQDIFTMTGATTNLATGSGQTITFDGTVADDSAASLPAGHSYTAGTALGGALTIGATNETGTVVLGGANTYSGGTTIADGALDLGAATAAGTGAITFAPLIGSATATLAIESGAQPTGGTFANTLSRFNTSSVLDLKGFLVTSTGYANGVLTLTGTLDGATQPTTENFRFANPPPTGFTTKSDNAGGTDVMVCFATGTAICTARGDVAVEVLRAGDFAVTASGALRPIRWIGYRTVDCRRHPRPQEAMPVRVAAHAFGADLPARDLYLSQGHPVLVGADEAGSGGVLVPIMCLVNGTTIERVAVDEVTYWHVELDAHDILLAEGLPAESYIDLGSRPWFDGAGGALYEPDMALPGMPGRCRPVAIDGPVIEAERRRLDAVFATRLALACAWPSGENAPSLL